MVKPIPTTLLSQWHPTLNGVLVPAEVSAGSKQKIWWQCAKGHEWQARVLDRARSDGKASGCPVCRGKKIVVGVNDLASQMPQVAQEWHPKNALTATEVTLGSNKKVSWLCAQGHEWEAAVCDRTRATGATNCPYCSHRRLLTGYNDLLTVFPDIAAEWNTAKNGKLLPSAITARNDKPVWWQCAKGHEWQASVADRTRSDGKANGCPICINRMVLAGFNDLATVNPATAAEWHPTLNGHLTPAQLTEGSNQKVWWQCAKGHEWQATPGGRKTGYNCMRCQAGQSSSAPERELVAYLQNLGVTVEQHNRELLKPYEVDIYLPDYQLAVEYNGLFYHSEAHKPRDYHQRKWQLAQAADITLLQIWDDDWRLRREVVQSLLQHKLHLNTQVKVYARKTDVQPATTAQARAFLDRNHIQGFASGSYYLGLNERGTNELVALMVLKKEPGNKLNIIRYATAASVPGGFTKLLTYATRVYTPKEFVTFSDHCISDGALYSGNGFNHNGELPPDYTYFINGERKHKFGYRLKRFRDDPSLSWVAGATETELAALNGLLRVWDAGKTRWVKPIEEVSG